MLVRVDNGAEAKISTCSSIKLICVPYVFEIDLKFYIVIYGFLALCAHHFLDCIPDVKWFDIFPEFSRLDLCEIKEILDHVVHEKRRVLLDYFTIFKLSNDTQASLKL